MGLNSKVSSYQLCHSSHSLSFSEHQFPRLCTGEQIQKADSKAHALSSVCQAALNKNLVPVLKMLTVQGWALCSVGQAHSCFLQAGTDPQSQIQAGVFLVLQASAARPSASS